MKSFCIWTVLVYVLVYPPPVDQKLVKAGSTSTENFISKLEKDRFEDKDFVQDVLKNVDEKNIRKFLKELSRKPHLAASKRDKELVTWIKSQWKKFGIESVSLANYTFLFSYPNHKNPNKVYLLDSENKIKFTTRHKEEVLLPEDEDPDFIHAFNGYAPAGDVTGDLVYVNYGRVEDIQQLTKLGVNLTGKIALSRYGKIFRGNRLHNCQEAGAIGVIMFSDPADVAVSGVEDDKVYPNTMFLPESGMQRGHVRLTKGDPLSPSWPSIKGAYRQDVNDTEGLPRIPSQPIGYGDAKHLLEIMAGDKVPASWQGGIVNVTYRLGPELSKEHHGWKVRMVVNNYLEEKEDTNVIGVIRGEIEPDRYVLLINHRDAWGYGALDPSSGTCVLMEAAQVLGGMVKTGWRPRRSIVFGSFGAEEYGLMGSTEWVHHKLHKLMNKAVAVINIDTCVSGDILSPEASPILKDVFVEAIKNVASSKDPKKSYYEFLEERLDEKHGTVEDLVKITGSGSDHAPFSFYAGIPALYFSFKVDKKKYPGVAFPYPTYHTGFETFHLMDKVVDPGFKIHKTCTQLGLHMLLNLAESKIMPLNPHHIGKELDKGVSSLIKENVTVKLTELGMEKPWKLVQESIEEFKIAVRKWSEKKEKCTKGNKKINPYEMRSLNDQIMLLERTFLLDGGLEGRSYHRHILFSPQKFNIYGGAAFPGISDLLHNIDHLHEENLEQRLKELKKHLSDIMIKMKQASSWLSIDDGQL